MSYQSKMEEYRKEYQQRRSRMLLFLKITVLALAAALLVLGVSLGVMLATDGFSSVGDTEDGGDVGPSIRGPEGDYVIVYIGDSGVSYKSFVKVTGNDTLQVDASKVNLKEAGVYTVHYTYGKLTYDLTVYVRQSVFGEAERKKLYEIIATKSRELEITAESNMVLSEKINRIWQYVSDKSTIAFVDRSNIAAAHGNAYSRNTWQTDWEEEAYLTLSSKQGDCYSFYSLSKAFFEYLEIENVGIQRSESSDEPGTHFWHAIKVGASWYYYDSTRLKGSFGYAGSRVLMIETMLQSYVTSDGGKEFYKFEKWNGFPTIATKEVG